MAAGFAVSSAEAESEVPFTLAAPHSSRPDPHELSLAKSAAYVALAMNRNTATFSSAFCQGTSSFPHLRDIHFPALLAGHRLVAWASICRSLKLLPSMFTTWQWCSRRSRMAVARISSPASMSGHWLMLLLLVMMVAPLS